MKVVTPIALAYARGDLDGASLLIADYIGFEPTEITKDEPVFRIINGLMALIQSLTDGQEAANGKHPLENLTHWFAFKEAE
jgi:hypothetical protein